jgi:putative nucleotidyltransferase with HDIG domain
VTDVSELTEALLRLPAQPVAAVRVLRIAEESNTSAAELARLIETDPVLSARVMRLANAPYYGLVRRVASASHAVVLLGTATVRALAVSAACSLLVEDARTGPRGYWRHSVTVAAAASVVARRVGARPADAFSAGLLHDLGASLLHRLDPDEATGRDHADVGADVLDAWRFPPEFVGAVRSHHAPPFSVEGQLARLVVAGEAVAHELDAGLGEPAAELAVALDAAGVRASPAALVEAARGEVARVTAFLGVDA